MNSVRIGDWEFSPRKNKVIFKKVDKKEVKEMKKNKFKVGERYSVDDIESRENGNLIEITMINNSYVHYKTIKGESVLNSKFYITSPFAKTLKPIKQEIHITTDGYKTTYGILKENGKVVKKVEARLHPSDTFDFMVGSSIVMGRLFDVKEDATGTIKVGDMVKVINNGYCFPYYKNWFKKTGCEYLESHFVKEKGPLDNHEYKVVAIGKHKQHPEDYGGWLYAIQNLDTTQVFVIGGKGIEKV